RILETLTGFPVLVPSPTKRDLEGIVDARIAELRPILKPVPFTFEHARAALAMVYAGVPPNGKKDQQFKDCAIWQAVLTLSPDHAVHFITNDRAVLRDKDNRSQGLAPN